MLGKSTQEGTDGGILCINGDGVIEGMLSLLSG
jgi:hypothetical protein